MTRTRELVLEELVAALDRLLVAYRTGGRPSGATLDAIARLRDEADRLAVDAATTPDPGWLVACDESYYPEVSAYDDEAGARRAFAELQARRLYGAEGHLARIVETTNGAPPQPPAPAPPGSVAEALSMPELVRRRVEGILRQQEAADRITASLRDHLGPTAVPAGVVIDVVPADAVVKHGSPVRLTREQVDVNHPNPVRAFAGVACLATLDVVTVSAAAPNLDPSPSVYLCTNARPCPQHPDRT